MGSSVVWDVRAATQTHSVCEGGVHGKVENFRARSTLQKIQNIGTENSLKSVDEIRWAWRWVAAMMVPREGITTNPEVYLTFNRLLTMSRKMISSLQEAIPPESLST